MIFCALALMGCVAQSPAPSGPASLQLVPPNYYSRTLPGPRPSSYHRTNDVLESKPIQPQPTVKIAKERTVNEKLDDVAEQLSAIQKRLSDWSTYKDGKGKK